jgi:hypothetical protein
MLTKTYKSDIYRFDIEYVSDSSIDFTITNVISWDVTTINITKEELQSLGDFISNTLKTNYVNK